MSFQVARAPGKLVQMVNTQTGAVASGTTVMPQDDTVPQITEGDQYMTRTITPKNAANVLVIEVVWNGSSNTNGAMHVALFVGSTAAALAVVVDERPNGTMRAMAYSHRVVAGVTTELTFRVRAGLHTANTTTFNGFSVARKYGGSVASSITITEYAP